ncbi:hypothetical protein BDA96_01G083700 [Sorghum bicolor]|uniref:Fatty acyl-CoA reductase n=1 Tax=Sorghum bicolor TaxID=4558 RepID=A0A921RYI0_SORBI|nr:hypothetical protein BDA96_01G083700 [Sorghum bicolor]
MGFLCTTFPLSGNGLLAARRTPPSLAAGSSGGGQARGRGRAVVMLPALSSSRDHKNGSCGGGSRRSLSLVFVNNGNSGGCRPVLATDDHVAGIGIAECFEGKNLLITGGTGFLAKVLIEKILRTNPDVGKIYVLIKAKDPETTFKRFQTEVIDTELFKRLQDIHGKSFHSFVARKLVPVVGDIREANLGITQELAHRIQDEVDIIVNSAGNTTFHERYDVAMDTNTLGPIRIMSFAQRFRRLKLFLHVSTAYVNGQRQGVVQEKPFCLGDSIANEILLCSTGSSEHAAGAVLDIEAEIKLAFDHRTKPDDSASSCIQEMKDLGLKKGKTSWLARYLCVHQGHGGDGHQQHARRDTGCHYQAKRHRKHLKGPLPWMDTREQDVGSFDYQVREGTHV